MNSHVFEFFSHDIHAMWLELSEVVTSVKRGKRSVDLEHNENIRLSREVFLWFSPVVLVCRVLIARGALCSRRFYKGYRVSGTSDLLLSPVSLDFQKGLLGEAERSLARRIHLVLVFEKIRTDVEIVIFIIPIVYWSGLGIPNKYRENPDEIRMVGHLFLSSSNLNLC